MAILFWFLGFMVTGDFLAYFLGLLVEGQWGSKASLMVFLTLYFLFLGVSWMLAVWMTKPKEVPVAAAATAV